MLSYMGANGKDAQLALCPHVQGVTSSPHKLIEQAQLGDEGPG